VNLGCPSVSNIELARLPAEDALLETRLAQLERAVRDQYAAADKRIAALTDAVSALRETLRPEDRFAAGGQIAGLEAELAARQQRLAEIEATAHQQITALSSALSAIEQSTTWRATALLRKLGSSLPEPTRMALRRAARRAYWALTPHRMPMRRKWVAYAPAHEQIVRRLAAVSAEVRHRLKPLRRAYGDSASEQLDIYRTSRPNAPVFVFIHGGAWRAAEAKNAAFAAETFVNAGAHYVVPDFIGVREAGGDLRLVAEQVCRSIAWVYRNAASFGGDPDRLYLGGHSSGGHLCAVALVTDWQSEFGLPADLAKGGVLMSGLYDMQSVRASRLSPHVKFTDEMEEAMSPHRHVDLLRAPIVVTCGGSESPEFQRQARDFCAAAKDAGKSADLIEAAHFGHMDMAESLGSPYGPNGRAMLGMMTLLPA
jgi:arylformamidase